LNKNSFYEDDSEDA